MQKKIIALAVAGLMSGAAFAQTNVQVYGVVDVYGAYTTADTNATGSGQDSGWVVGSGGLSGSRIGFKGTEDLGGGLKALFTVEYAVAADNNSGLGADTSGNQTRQAFVGLTDSWGTFVAGRLQTTAYDWDVKSYAFSGTNLDAKGRLAGHTTLSAGFAGRANNAVAYISPTFSGFTLAYNHARLTENDGGRAAAAATAAALAGGVASLPGAGGDDSDAYANMVSVDYTNGPISAGLVYSAISSDALNSVLAYDSNKEWGVRGSYDFGVAKLWASYQTNKRDFGVAGVADQDDDKYQIGVTAPIGANGTVGLQYADSDIDLVKQDAKAWSLAYTHNLSKRTTAYVGYVHVSNDDNTSRTAHSQFRPANGENTSSYTVGMRHTF